jgi:hypothetical protein
MTLARAALAGSGLVKILDFHRASDGQSGSQLLKTGDHAQNPPVPATEEQFCRSLYSVNMATTTSRSLGPSSSTSTTRCHVPSSIFPCSKGNETDVPISAERM